MHKFDYSFLDEGMLPAEMVNLTASIAAFDAISSVRKDGNQSIYTELEKIARVQSVKKIGQARATKYVNVKYID